jgi:hypothetical protein
MVQAGFRGLGLPFGPEGPAPEVIDLPGGGGSGPGRRADPGPAGGVPLRPFSRLLHLCQFSRS